MPSPFEIRIFRHPLSSYYQGDLKSVDRYTGDYFRRLLDHGFEGVWLQVAMRSLVPFGCRATAQQRANMGLLRRLIDRADRHGAKVYLYQNEPRALPPDDPFWQRYPEARGEPSRSGMDGLPKSNALCTSTEVVRSFIRQSARELYRRAQGLAGAFLITASEHHTHCYSHVIVRDAMVFATDTEHFGIDCPRCKGRQATDVVAEVLNLYRDGVRDAGSKADVIAWNWSWVMYEADPQPSIIGRLRKDILVMADFERGGVKTLSGRKVHVDEYSLSYVGPSPRFKRLSRAAQSLRHRAVAKLQLNVTHELATVANVPLPGVVYDKLSRLASAGGKGFLGCWNFGTFFGLNTAAVGLFHETAGRLEKKPFLARLAQEHFGPVATAPLLRALAGFQKAFSLYPFDNNFVYYGPVNFALGLPIHLKPQEKSPLTGSYIDLPRGNDWDACLGKFSLTAVIRLLEEMARRWGLALAMYQRALFPQPSFRPLDWGRAARTPAIALDSPLLSDKARIAAVKAALPAEALRDWPVLKTIQGVHRLEEWCSAFGNWACLASARNILAAHGLHKRPSGPARDAAVRAVMAEETALVENVIPVCQLDGRLGYHGECQAYLFDAHRCRAKLRIMRQALARR